MVARRIVQVTSLIPAQDGFPKKIEEDCIERLEAVLVARVISEQDVLLEKEHVILTAFDEGQPVVQNVVSCRGLVAKQGLPGPRQGTFLDLLDRLKHVLA